jgi:prepilin-type N-terminal cleavage/methylation domain-containing protein
MLMTQLHQRLQPMSGQQGFTLIETLVAMIAGVIVLGALVLIFEITINETSRIDETTQANQSGRLTMTKIVDELQSACLGREFAPVQGTSTESKLRFVNAYSKEANIPASEAFEHEIVWSKSAGTLTEYKYAGASGENTNITFSGTASPTSGTLLGEKLSAGGTSETTPIFRYYKYNTTPTSGTEAAETALTQIEPASETTALGTTVAKEVAAVVVTFKGGARHEELLRNETKAQKSLPTELSDQVTFAFAAPTSESTIKDGPCR